MDSYVLPELRIQFSGYLFLKCPWRPEAWDTSGIHVEYESRCRRLDTWYTGRPSLAPPNNALLSRHDANSLNRVFRVRWLCFCFATPRSIIDGSGLVVYMCGGEPT